MGKATREAYGNALARIGKENTNIIVLDADLSKSTKTDAFKAVCPERFFNVGIAEESLSSVGGGGAGGGGGGGVGGWGGGRGEGEGGRGQGGGGKCRPRAARR